jgi:hypothetical protein
MKADLNLIPTPQFVVRNDKAFRLAGDYMLEIVVGPAPDPKLGLAATTIREHVSAAARGMASRVCVVEQQTDADGRILLLDVDRNRADAAGLSPADLQAIGAACGQGYLLRTQDDNAVSIWGRPQGILWGAMTLLQLLHTDSSGVSIPGIHIRDFPDFEFRCAADWMVNAEGNRSSMDRGQGWPAFEELCRRKIDQCMRYKINGILFDGFGWGLQQRPAEYPAVVRRLTQYARQRGVHLSFGGYGAGYGMAFQKGPLYEDAQYLGRVFRNQAHYPDGPVYQCTGETRAHAVRKGVDPRVLGTCRSNDALNRLKAQELQDFVRAVEPGMLYIHHEDYGSCRNTEAAWKARCERCRQRWPNDDATSPDGAAGAIASGYTWLINAVNEVKNERTGYMAARDCQILLVSPVYCLSDATPQAWDAALRFWQNAGRQLPAAPNVMVCFREIFPQGPGRLSWTDSFNAAMRDAGLNLGAIIFFITGGDHWLNDYPFVGGCALNNLFLGARAILHDNGNAYQEPLQLLNAEYAWNTRSTGYAPRPQTHQETWELWIGLCENEIAPAETYGENGLLLRGCSRLYGASIAHIMARYFTAFETLQEAAGNREGVGTHQDEVPRRKSYLPMTSNRVHALPILWRALALDSKTWGAEIDNERMLTEMSRLLIDRPELHRRLKRRWVLTGRMLELGENLLAEAFKRAASNAVRDELQFLLDATRTKLPLARGLASFHDALAELLGPQVDRGRAASLLSDALSCVRQASALAQEHYPLVVDPVGEVGALKTYLARLETAISDRVALLMHVG